MLKGNKIIVVMPAFNAEHTLKDAYSEIPFDIVDEVILVDDASKDDTVKLAHELGIKHVIVHSKNLGYGGNQKTCYNKALELGADIVIMLHPDYQYAPQLIAPMASLIASGLYPVVFGSRILGKGAIKGGMPRYKYFFNRILTFSQNLLMNQKLSEYHTGYRAMHRKVLETVPYTKNSDNFVFDNQIVAQMFYHGFDVAEITCPTKYFPEGSSIGFFRSINYGLGVLLVSFQYAIASSGLYVVSFLRKN
ncbi:MAG: glycosyltransferase family 2 protein [Bacteroidetes bacterium]|nr:MAG: glycosyltransferase family 2 protein [Bacteroidota bacterium]